jgi:hypothetical protein
MSVYEAVKLPTCRHTKLDTTARNPKDAAYPAQTLKYVELTSFPEVGRISRDIPICGIIPSRPPRSRTFLNPAQRPPTADQQPRPPSPPTAGTGRPGHGSRSCPGPRRTNAPKQSRTGQHRSQPRSWSPWPVQGTSGHGRRTRTAAHTAFTAATSGSAAAWRRVRTPHPDSCRGPVALANEASGRPGRASPIARIGDCRRQVRATPPRRPCPRRARSTGARQFISVSSGR